MFSYRFVIFITVYVIVIIVIKKFVKRNANFHVILNNSGQFSTFSSHSASLPGVKMGTGDLFGKN